MTKTNKIIFASIVLIVVIGTSYYFWQKRKNETNNDIPKVDTKTTTGEYIAKDDERFGKGLGVLEMPKKPTSIPTTTTPNFTKSIF